LLARFSAATLELNPSVGTEELSKRLTAAVRQMLGVRAATLALKGVSNWQIAALSGPANRWNDEMRRALAARFAELATIPWSELRSGSASRFLGLELAESFGWQEVVLARLTGSDDGQSAYCALWI
jgi:hypothetical protein